MRFVACLVLPSCVAATQWQQYAGINCYKGHGASEIDSTAVAGIGVEACKAKCGEISACTGITVGGNGDCFRRSSIDVQACTSDSYYTTYVVVNPAPSPAPSGTWEEHDQLTCYTGHGATEIDKSPLSDVTGVDACEVACTAYGTSCDSVSVGNGGECYRRSNTVVSQCGYDSYYKVFLKPVGPTPVPAPVPTPVPQPVPVPTPTPAQDCLCIFDIDRTLTGIQGDVADCPGNSVQSGVYDSAYDTGDLTLGELALSLGDTFCSKCHLATISAGDASGGGSAERSILYDHMLDGDEGKTLPKKWSEHCSVTSPLVTGCADGKKQTAVPAIIQWYTSNVGAQIADSDVHFFDDRESNIQGFQGSSYNARQISCATRDHNRGDAVGLCGATVDEIISVAGVALCSDPTPQPSPSPSGAGYIKYSGKNTYSGHGGTEIDSDTTAPSGISASSCEGRCDSDANCGCVAFRPSDGKCWKRGACVPSQFGSDSHYNTYVKKSDPSTRLGSFIIIGDWGHDPNSHGDIYSDKCQNTVAASMDAEMSRLGDVKFVVNVGDSFYPNGVSSKSDGQWDSKWRNVYSQGLRSVPWYSVYGNHDFHKDPGACSDIPADGAQINGNISDLSTFYMPDYSWNIEHPELDLEVVGLELNNYQNGWNQNIPASQQSFSDCQYTSCQSQCYARMKARSESAFSLFKKRAASSAAKNLVVFSHYPTDYFWDTSSGDTSGDFLANLKTSKQHIAYFGGHRHNVDQTSTISIAPNDNWLSGGGGGWSCDGSLQGFVVGEIASDGTLTTRAVYIDQGQCCGKFSTNTSVWV